MQSWDKLLQGEPASDLTHHLRDERMIEMNEEQATKLAEQIKAEFPHTWTCALESVDKRNSPRNFFVAVRRSPIVDGEPCLILHHEHEWKDALTALRVLGA